MLFEVSAHIRRQAEIALRKIGRKMAYFHCPMTATKVCKGQDVSARYNDGFQRVITASARAYARNHKQNGRVGPGLHARELEPDAPRR